MSESKVKVAAIQAAPVFLDLEASLQKAVGLIEEAAAHGRAAAGLPRGVPARLAGLGRRGAARRGRGLARAAAGAVGGGAGAGHRAPGRRRPRRGRAPGDGGQRARGARRHDLQHDPVLRRRRPAARQAPQARADPRRAAGVGHGRRLRPAGAPDRGRPGGRADLLGELHAAGPLRDVRPGRRHLGRADAGHPRAVGGHACATSPGRASATSSGWPRRRASPTCPTACPTASGCGGGRTARRLDAGRLLGDRRPGRRPCWPDRWSARKASCTPPSTSTPPGPAGACSTRWVTTTAPTSSGWSSTTVPSRTWSRWRGSLLAWCSWSLTRSPDDAGAARIGARSTATPRADHSPHRELPIRPARSKTGKPGMAVARMSPWLNRYRTLATSPTQPTQRHSSPLAHDQAR